MTDALFEFVERNGTEDYLEPGPKEDFFASGWITVEGAVLLLEKLNLEMDAVSTLHNDPKTVEQVETILEFVLQLELTMAIYNADYFFSAVNLLGSFMIWHDSLIQLVSTNNRLQLRYYSNSTQIPPERVLI